jgi:serine/threonine protein kinase
MPPPPCACADSDRHCDVCGTSPLLLSGDNSVSPASPEKELELSYGSFSDEESESGDTRGELETAGTQSERDSESEREDILTSSEGVAAGPGNGGKGGGGGSLKKKLSRGSLGASGDSRDSLLSASELDNCACQQEIARLRAEVSRLRSVVLALEQRTTIDRSRLVIGPRIGGGHHGAVFSGVYEGAPVCVKQIRATSGGRASLLHSADSRADMNAIREFEAEISMLRALPSHPNLLQFIGASTDPSDLCLVTRLCEKGSLHSYLRKGLPLPPRERKNLMVGVACGMQFLHVHRIVHRDLAARNVLLDAALAPYIADFGLSRFLGTGQDEGRWTAGSTSFPLRFLAPEVAKRRRFSPKSDAWAFGLLLVEIFTRSQPYPSLEAHEVVVGLAKGTVHPDVPPEVSSREPIVARVMRSCWRVSANERPDFEDIQTSLEAVPVLDDDDDFDFDSESTGGDGDNTTGSGSGSGSGSSKAKEDDSWLIDESDMSLGDVIGEGSGGVVRKCTVGAMEYAFKQFKVDLDSNALKGFERELSMMKRLHHPNILMLIGITGGDNPGMITELAEGGCLLDLLQSDDELPADLRLRVLHDVACGMEYLHARGFVHSDIAARNVMSLFFSSSFFSSSSFFFALLLCDFSLSKLFRC